MAGRFFQKWMDKRRRRARISYKKWMDKQRRRVHISYKKWMDKRRRRAHISHTETDSGSEHDVLEHPFSPMTYQNPCIFRMHAILRQVIKEKQLSYQKLELILIDAEQEDDRGDVRDVLSQLSQGLNYLMLITDMPSGFEDYIYTMYEENGLIVQQLPKTCRVRARGNLILDFERSGGITAESMIRPETIYLPIYKKPWEIAENLDIMVPVGYNTLVVRGISLPQTGECHGTADRLEQEFRKG